MFTSSVAKIQREVTEICDLEFSRKPINDGFEIIGQWGVGDVTKIQKRLEDSRSGAIY